MDMEARITAPILILFKTRLLLDSLPFGQFNLFTKLCCWKKLIKMFYPQNPSKFSSSGG
jgi:hypothetical protein